MTNFGTERIGNDFKANSQHSATDCINSICIPIQKIPNMVG